MFVCNHSVAVDGLRWRMTRSVFKWPVAMQRRKFPPLIFLVLLSSKKRLRFEMTCGSAAVHISNGNSTVGLPEENRIRFQTVRGGVAVLMSNGNSTVGLLEDDRIRVQMACVL